MKLSHYPHHPWKIIEEGWNPENVKASESIFSLGNGAMGQRANFEEDYSGSTFQGSYVGGVYYPDKTRVGWWKNGYPEYFAKVLNAPNWIGLHLKVNGTLFDLNKAQKISSFYRELDMKTGLYTRRFNALFNGTTISIECKRLLSLARPRLGALEYVITSDQDVSILVEPYLDAGITNHDSNWDDQFWDIDKKTTQDCRAYIEAHTLKTNFNVGTFMETQLFEEGKQLALLPKHKEEDQKISHQFSHELKANTPLTIVKYGGYVSSRNYRKDRLEKEAMLVLDEASKLPFSTLCEEQKIAWANTWKSADITIEGDVKAQQAIRFNIFQLNQTYTGDDAGLNIGPKGFTGEKYGGSTYWDTEAYCIPFYMATKK